MHDMSNTLMTIKQLSEKYDVAIQTIHKVTSAKKIPYFRNGGRGKVFIRESDFIDYITDGLDDKSKVA